MWLITLGYGFGKTRAVRCYITLLLWIILASLAFYWFLTQYNLSTDNNFIWTFEQYRVDQEKERANSYKSYNSIFHQSKTAEDRLHDGLKAPRINHNAKYSDVDFFEEYDGQQSAGNEENGPDLKSSVKRLCNPPDEIRAGDENLKTPEFQLDAMILVFRHGDRGPLSHAGSRNLSNIDCSASDAEVYKLKKFMTDTVSKISGYPQFIGPFQSFQKAPANKNCQLGQLSQLGSLQLLRLGKVIKEAYGDVFSKFSADPNGGLSKTGITNTSRNISFSGKNSVADHPFKRTRIISYSTRYRRTLQSLMAFLYGLLGPKLMVSNSIVRESQSISFCFNDCSCHATDSLKKISKKQYMPKPSDKSSMISLLDRMNSVLGSGKSKKTGTTLLDLLLVYPCHNTDLPCKESSGSGAVEFQDCITERQVSSLINLLQKENFNQKKIASYQQYHTLTSYGLLKEIVNLSLKMTSSGTGDSKRSGRLNSKRFENNVLSSSAYFRTNSKTRIGLFSGHDTTLQSLAGALGIYSGHPDIHLVPYASRLVFEFYRKTNVSPESPRKHYFRVVFNGKVVTHLIKFCRLSDKVIFADAALVEKVAANSDTNQNHESPGMSGLYMLCPLENLVRFVHDRYFESFGNVTNFKEACERNG